MQTRSRSLRTLNFLFVSPKVNANQSKYPVMLISLLQLIKK